MADYTLTLTVDQDAILAKLVARANALRARKDPPLPALTVNQVLTQELGALLSFRSKEDQDRITADVNKAFANATDAVKLTIKQQLGVE